MKDLTLQEYMELLKSEGLIIKGMNDSEYVSMDATGNESDNDEENDSDESEFNLIIMTSDEDRNSDILNPYGCETDLFKNNPLFLWEHGKQLPLVDSILGRIRNIEITESQIIARARYEDLVNNPIVTKVWEMETKGLLPGNSMGFRPLSGIRQLDNGKRYVDKWELLEVSKVVLPMNGKASNVRLSA